MPAPEIQWPTADDVVPVNVTASDFALMDIRRVVTRAIDLAKEAVARAFDDPSQSPVGEVRQLPAPDARMVVKTDRPESPWVLIVSGDDHGLISWLTDEFVVGWPVVDQLHTIPATSS